MRPDATADEVRRAYHRRARELHPDAAGATAGPGPFTIQDVNEAWRVLRDPGRRRAYDRSLRPPAPPRPPADDPLWDPDADLDPTPYRHAVADPHDVGIRVVRHLPWLVLVVVLGLIFVFTAYAGSGGDDDGTADEQDLVGRCVRIVSADDVEEVPCSGPNDGEVVLIDFDGSGCPSDLMAHTMRAGGVRMCIRET